MISFPLTDAHGALIGHIILNDYSVPNLIVNNVELLLSGSYKPSTGVFLSFMVVPLPAKEARGN